MLTRAHRRILALASTVRHRSQYTCLKKYHLTINLVLANIIFKVQILGLARNLSTCKYIEAQISTLTNTLMQTSQQMQIGVKHKSYDLKQILALPNVIVRNKTWH